MAPVRELLLKLRLAHYTNAFEEAGYDDAAFLMRLSADGLRQVAMTVRMRPGHTHKFVDLILNARRSDDHVPAVKSSQSNVTDAPTEQQPQQVMPTVYIAGPVKGGTTSIFNCLVSSFSPARVCGATAAGLWSDARCGPQRFVVPSLSIHRGGWGSPFALKESRFGVWGHSAGEEYGWRMVTGPALPLRLWEQRHKTASGLRPVAPSDFAEMLANLCRPGCGPLPPEDGSAGQDCTYVCDACDLHPGTDVYDPRTTQVRHVPCSSPRKPCASPVCLATNDSMPRFGVLVAVPHERTLVAANVTPSRVMAVEGNPAVFAGGGLGGMSRQLGLLTHAGGRSALRFIVGLREPIALALSYWMWNQRAWRLLAGPMVYFDKGVQALSSCEQAVVGMTGQPDLLLHLPDSELRRYYACVKRISDSMEESDKLLGGMYALSLSAFFFSGFTPSQFLLVPSEALSDEDLLQRSLASFLGLQFPSQNVSCPRTQSSSTNTKKLVGNRSLDNIVAEFYQSAAHERAHRFFSPHNSLLAHTTLVHHPEITIAGEAPSWLKEAARGPQLRE